MASSTPPEVGAMRELAVMVRSPGAPDTTAPGRSMLFAGGRFGFVFVERVIVKSGFTPTNAARGVGGEF